MAKDVYEELILDLIASVGLSRTMSERVVDWLSANDLIDYYALKETYLD